MTQSTPQPDRIAFLDNLRSLMILLVVILHSSLAYCNLTPWWPVWDDNRSVIFDIFVLIRDSFGMPVLFFIAGYFTLPALQRKKAVAAFLISKLKRLGIPLILGIYLLVPVMPYLGRVTRETSPSTGYGEFWLDFVKLSLDFKLEIMKTGQVFTHGHLWFLSLLLAFYFLFLVFYVGLRKPVEEIIKARPEGRDRTSGKTLSVLLILWFIPAVLAAWISLYVSNLAWINFYNILVFRPVRFPVYFGYFLFGIYFNFRGGWRGLPLPGNVAIILAFSVLLSVAYLTEVKTVLEEYPDYTLTVALTHHGLHSAVCLSYFCLLMALLFKYGNRSSRLSRALADNSYYIYWVHMPIVLGLQWIFHGIDWSIYIKFILAACFSIMFSYGLSEWLIRRAGKLLK
ncbi:MAG: acyltransferase family protein [Nitrospinaceae bacterium]|nr:acyltransferase family protein [Nitrospinaceae bacterium]NIR57727.1 acyltransferase family protein [Nitrospinaceae bacterium]NIS88187.1 acyltransferase family protein [Nitrospinaceae bacterium]NIT83286.1 acyltransferase family protein [Nitrospinaceae bacterium]NIU47225.1 acyltransferase family protein [Nitrospinaceae bacterium]